MRSECGLPDGGDIERAGPITRLAYHDNGLVRCLEVYPKQFSVGLLQWQFASPMLWFLTDRRDLGRMLICQSDRGIRRGEVIGNSWAELAAGIAAAVILARAMGDPDLEAASRTRSRTTGCRSSA